MVASKESSPARRSPLRRLVLRIVVFASLLLMLALAFFRLQAIKPVTDARPQQAFRQPGHDEAGRSPLLLRGRHPVRGTPLGKGVRHSHVGGAEDGWIRRIVAVRGRR
jgi:hypothetical protein